MTPNGSFVRWTEDEQDSSALERIHKDASTKFIYYVALTPDVCIEAFVVSHVIAKNHFIWKGNEERLLTHLTFS